MEKLESVIALGDCTGSKKRAGEACEAEGFKSELLGQRAVKVLCDGREWQCEFI